MLAQNDFGSSAASKPGISAIITTNPDAPVDLTIDQPLMAFSWNRGNFDGGTKVINYRLNWDQGADNYTALEDGISQQFFTAKILT